MKANPVALASYTLDRLTATSITATQEVLDWSRAQMGPIKRMAHRAIVDFARRNPETWTALYSGLMLQQGYRLINSGSDCTVVTADEATALKIDRHSQLQSREDRKARAKRKTELYSTANRYLGKFLLPEEVTIERAPFKHRPTVVVTRQPLVAPAVPDFVHADSDVVQNFLDKREVSASMVGKEVLEFCLSGRAMWENEGLLPDVGGIGNLVMTNNGRLVLIDSYPVGMAELSRPSTRRGYETRLEYHTAVMDRLMAFGEDLVQLPVSA